MSTGRGTAQRGGPAYNELAAFLDTAPDSLRDWADDQLSAARGGAAAGSKRGRSALLVPFLAFLLVVAVVYGVWAAGRPAPSAASTASATTASAPVLNEARVAELTAKVQANPKDVTALRGLTDEYYSVGDYGKAAQWQTKVVELQPNDVTSRLVLGAALANSGDSAQAEAQWTKVTQLDPKQAEAWYNLGVLHFSATPSQDDKARAEWAKVVEIDPNSELAKNVTSHLNRVGVATTK